ncbi:uncharacterized protein LOC118510291 isoform X5 [Anopheles stephensi]|uniref:uncharacterized protein LOC118510291 isoform X5 n=1 Tax=Anopheles stephensi TaxID=30069 RepID=UPI001658A591|nr:uncharacterized protein LOC118510291 isoform X5 [Anopheles stephensi]
MRVLNIFHALLITNVRTVRSKDRTVGYIIARPRLQLLLPLFTILTLAFLNPWVTGHKQCTNCVNWFTIVSRLLATLIVALLLVFDNFRQRHKVLALLQTIPSAGSVGGTRSSERYTVKRLQLSMLLLCNLLSLVELLYNVYRTHVYLYIWGVFTGVIIEYYILLNSLLCQTLAETIANTYDTLQRALPVRPFSSVIDEMVVLGRCKDQLSDAIGLKLLLVMMHLLFNISFCAYDILQKIVSQAHMHNIARLTIIALQETVVLFGLCFYYSLLTLKEAELKDALKSMQYRQLQKQTRDQKDFYDLVNLKLMMASPKITACGLFEINLQIFYNVRHSHNRQCTVSAFKKSFFSLSLDRCLPPS